MEENKISSDLIRGHIDTIILYSLTESDKFAQQISDFIDERSEKKYQINQATLYSSLKRLETLKFVTSYRYDCDEGGRRKFFKITDIGKDFVKENLNNWSYSRVIIDKLMGCEYTPSVYITQNQSKKSLENSNEIEFTKTEQKIKEEPVAETASPQPSVQIFEEKTIENPVVQPIQKVEIQPQKTMESPTPEVTEEINFRNILNGLIKSAEKPAPTQPTKEKVKIEITDVNRTKEPEVLEKKQTSQKPVLPKFNEEIEKTTYSSKNTYAQKTDYTDVTAKYALEGYKIRVSNKGPIKVLGNLMITKLRLFSMLIFLAFPIAEAILLQFVAKIPIFSSIPAIVSLSLVVLALGYSFINYLKDKNKVVFKNINFDLILNACIIVFNLLLFTFALNFIFGIDLGVKFNLFSYLIVPIVTSINIIIYFAIELVLFKSDKFKPVKK